MKKRALLLLATLSLYSEEIRYGHGTMDFSGGFLGLNKTISESVDIYSIEENHKNIFSSNVFYSFNLTLYDSKKLKQMQNIYNTGINQAVSWMPFVSGDIFVPTIDYRIKGVDASISIGYDLIHKSENSYFGVAPYLGINLPTISSSSDNSFVSIPDNIDTSVLKDFYKASDTDITTFKLGASFYSSYEIKKSISIYLNGAYAYQTGSIANSYINSDFSVDGTYSSLDAGLKFSPLDKDYKLLGITLSPRLYMTLGAKYDKWDIDDVALDISGLNLKTPKSTMSIENKSAYFGVGYSF